MQEWYEPDPIFSFLDNPKTQEEFAQNWVVKGRFHFKVPENILKSYVTAEYLMAHAWYHWPMFDEALKKLLGIVEMAVKLRCEALHIDLKFERTDKLGNKTTGEKNLATLIDQLSKAEPSKGLKTWLHHVRWLRNMYAHPKEHNLMGGIAVNKIKNIVNLINLIFLDEAPVKAAKAEFAKIQKEFANFKDGVFVLEYGQSRYLITETKLLEVFQVEEQWVYVCFFNLVLIGFYKDFSEQKYPPSLILALTKQNFTDGVFEALDIENETGIKVLKTTNPDNLKTKEQYQKEWEQLSVTNQNFYALHIQAEQGANVRDLMYKYCWTTD